MINHKIYKIGADGKRVYMGSGTEMGAAARAQELGQRPQNQGARFIVEKETKND